MNKYLASLYWDSPLVYAESSWASDAVVILFVLTVRTFEKMMQFIAVLAPFPSPQSQGL